MHRFGVLFLCTGNSARSILAECALRRHGGARFAAHSAGSRPAGQVHPLALRLLGELGQETRGLRSKGWEEFARPGAPRLDAVITVCDAAAAEPCPVWPGGPPAAHWGVEDPAAFEGPEAEYLERFRAAHAILERRVRALVALPVERLGPAELRSALEAIGLS